MNRLKADQRTKVNHFMQWTQQTEATAISCLTKSDWNLDYAVDLFYQNPHWSQSQQPVDQSKLQEMFYTYANDPRDETGPQTIGPNGILRLLNDLDLEPTDRRVLLLACKLKAQTQCEFSWEEWEKGLSSLRVDSIDKLRDKLNQLDAGLTDQNAFRELYLFTFAYGKPVSQKAMDLDSSLTYWRILFKDLFPLLDEWEDFLRRQHGKGISKDTWDLLLSFCYDVKQDFSNYDEDGAWPVLIDQFVEYMKAKVQ